MLGGGVGRVSLCLLTAASSHCKERILAAKVVGMECEVLVLSLSRARLECERGWG
jgi:hypothetical protein